MLICLNGGLGNQIGNYVFAQFLIEKGIECKIVASNSVNDCRDIVLDKLGIELDFAERADIEKFISAKTSPCLLFNLLTKNIFDKIWRNNLWNFLKRIRAEYQVYPKKTPFLLSKIVSYKDVLKYGLNQGAVCDCYSPIPEFNDENFKEKMRETLFSRERERFMDIKNLSLLEKIKNTENSVGVHIRRGDFLKYGIPVVKPEFVLEKIKYMTENLDGARFFIFSNGIDWAKEHLKTLDNIEFADINDEAHGYLDFLLFNECRHRIYSNSTFSLWARYFNPYKGSIAGSLEFYPEDSDMQVETSKKKDGVKHCAARESGAL